MAPHSVYNKPLFLTFKYVVLLNMKAQITVNNTFGHVIYIHADRQAVIQCVNCSFSQVGNKGLIFEKFFFWMGGEGREKDDNGLVMEGQQEHLCPILLKKVTLQLCDFPVRWSKLLQHVMGGEYRCKLTAVSV